MVLFVKPESQVDLTTNINQSTNQANPINSVVDMLPKPTFKNYNEVCKHSRH